MGGLHTTIRNRPFFLVPPVLVLLLFFYLARSPSTPIIEQIKQDPERDVDPLASYSTFMQDPSNSLGYRNHLERTTSPRNQLEHSNTLSFSKIYVLSLPHRTDRREEMLKLAGALGLEIVFVDAALKTDPFFQWIAEQVASTRKRRVELMSPYKKVPPEKIGGIKMKSPWLSQTIDASGRVPFPQLKHNWVEQLEKAYENGELASLVPKDRDANISELVWDHNEPKTARQVNDGVLSTYWGHTRVLQEVIRNGDKSALIMEDDVDIEWDIERMWSRIEMRLPKAWDVAYLGHCWSHELIKPAYLNPLLHQTTQPMCLHGWAVTQEGAQKLLSVLNNPWNAYTVPVDLAVPAFILSQNMTSFSVDPPLIIQRKDGPSDIQKGNGSKWKGLLRDSTWERILTDEGIPFEEDVWDSELSWEERDPATVFREKLACNVQDGKWGEGGVQPIMPGK